MHSFGKGKKTEYKANRRDRVECNAVVLIPPPVTLCGYGPSALMRYLITAGGWDYGRFADEISIRHRTSTIGVGTVSEWANSDVVPKNYRLALFRLIDDLVEAEFQAMWRAAFQTVWAEHAARNRMIAR